MKLYEIIPDTLFQRGKMNHQSDAAKTAMLKEKGIGMVIGLVSPPDPFFENWKTGRYIYYPVPDGKLRLNIVMEMERIADVVYEFIRDKKGAVLVHCEAGRNRSSFLSALIVGRVFGLNGEQSMNYVLERRPNAFSNPEWRTYLEERK